MSDWAQIATGLLSMDITIDMTVGWILLAVLVMAAMWLWSWIRGARVRWYPHVLYRLPVIKTIGKFQYARGHRLGARWGLGEGYQLMTKRRLSQRQIERAMKRAGV
ncbi:MAG: hypothetical protein KAU50_10105 [Candidatus Marinimicrobia bacterium]|nr:hypothetical protein [Candidatus Neomarinimicrobiota bacterium]